ncbi:MAG: hypothetical protein LBF50_03670 [Azoarcus sp.]|nr:hypothetical protein [Azoarcus sp.]
MLDFSQQGSDVRVLDRTLAAKQVSGEHFFHSEAMSEHVARDKSCKPVIYGGGSSGYMSSYKCVYAGKTLLDAYLRVRKEYTRENPKLRATLTAGTNHKDDFDEYETIAYQWHGAKKLVINISTEGSETDWEFTQTEKGVEVVCKYVMTT